MGSFRPQCRECGNTRDFREYEWVSYVVTYEQIEEGQYAGQWGKESETEEYGEFPDGIYQAQCLECESENVEWIYE